MKGSLELQMQKQQIQISSPLSKTLQGGTDLTLSTGMASFNVRTLLGQHFSLPDLCLYLCLVSVLSLFFASTAFACAMSQEYNTACLCFFVCMSVPCLLVCSCTVYHCLLRLRVWQELSQECANACWREEGCQVWNFDR